MASRNYQSDAARWAAVEARDRDADGRFYYAVKTTGVVCRPGCASRRPLRRNVAFFATLPDALRGGFRPCRRCRPGDGGGVRAPRSVIDACRIIESSESAPGLAELGKALGLSPSRLHRAFKSALGITPKDYAEALKAQRFRAALEDKRSVTEAVYEAGYGSSSRAYERAPDHLGMTPTQYRQGAKGLTVEFVTGRCRLGAVIVAATGNGICAVELGDRQRELARQLRERFADARAARPGHPLHDWVSSVIRQIEEPGFVAGLPLDIQGTAFQLKVWQALREIPVGTTRSYAQVARDIGKPGAARAVARACATNSVAVLVPCHRVVRGDGSISGYKWGVERKRRLLRDEADSGK